jgi:hypothetical protein
MCGTMANFAWHDGGSRAASQWCIFAIASGIGLRSFAAERLKLKYNQLLI